MHNVSWPSLTWARIKQQQIPSPRTVTVKLTQHASMEQLPNTLPLHEKMTTWFNTYVHVCGPCRPPMFQYCLCHPTEGTMQSTLWLSLTSRVVETFATPAMCQWSVGLKQLITLTLETAVAPCVCDIRLGQETSLCQPKERISRHRITIFYHADGLGSDAASIPTNHPSPVHSLDLFSLSVAGSISQRIALTNVNFSNVDKNRLIKLVASTPIKNGLSEVVWPLLWRG